MTVKFKRLWLGAYQSRFPDDPADVFHIGYHKTATTFIQEEIVPFFLDSKKVFSHEGISGNILYDDLEAAKILYDINPDARIVIVTRAQQTMFPSFYWLYVKSGGSLVFQDYIRECIDNRKFDYAAMIKAYHSVFSPSQVKVMQYESFCRDRVTFLSSFATFVFGKEREVVDMSVMNRVNKSPSAFVVEIVRRVNEYGLDKSRKKALTKIVQMVAGKLAFFLGQSHKRMDSYLNDELVLEIENAYKVSNRDYQELVQEDLSVLGYPV